MECEYQHSEAAEIEHHERGLKNGDEGEDLRWKAIRLSQNG